MLKLSFRIAWVKNTYFLHLAVHSYINNLKTRSSIVLYSARIYMLPVTKSYLTIRRSTYGYIKTTILTDFQSPVTELYFTVPAIRYYEKITLLSCSFQDLRTGQSYGKRIPITFISRTTLSSTIHRVTRNSHQFHISLSTWALEIYFAIYSSLLLRKKSW